MGNATDIQIDGDHYKHFKIQPVEFITKNDLGFLEGCVIKRMCRYDLKGTPLKDLRKAQHEIDLLIEMLGLKERDEEHLPSGLSYYENKLNGKWTYSVGVD